MDKQVLGSLVVEYYRHQIEISFTKVEPASAISHLDDQNTVDDYAIKDVLEQIKYGNEQGEFTGETHIHINPEDYGETLVEFSGTWRILPHINQIRRVLKWKYNHDHNDALTKTTFVEYFGTNMGEHYYGKWVNLYNHDLIKMLAYYGENTPEATKFLDMVMSRVRRYEHKQAHPEQHSAY